MPQFKSSSTSAPKKKCQESLSEALTGAAVAFAEAFSGTSSQQKPSHSSVVPTQPGVSPTKTVDLRVKNYELLRYNSFMRMEF